MPNIDYERLQRCAEELERMTEKLDKARDDYETVLRMLEIMVKAHPQGREQEQGQLRLVMAFVASTLLTIEPDLPF